ncbi:Thimet oligopeptidase [Clonorchis sinensis]|uniref:Thimet oligopeptidase n=1 Tax=Clonorchis sinensis TaxID=79923 RepID=A0A8T1MB45_CLOSI|nr:Thimet oligopeptidase [Clonorchis sinensis]
MFGVLQRFARRMAIPGCFLTWDTSVNLLNSRTDSLIKKARAVYDQVGSVSNPTWRSVAQSLSYFEAEYSVEKEMLTFPQYVFPDKSIRDASCDAARKISDVEVELEMRKDVFDQFVHIQSNLDSTVPAEMKRYVDRKVRDGRRAGLHLDEKGRKKIEELSKEENRLCIDFQRALDEENTVLEFTKEELAGCPEDFLRGLKMAPSGKLQITLKYPHYFPASEKASNPATRRTLEKAFNSRCIKENTPILKRLMELRKERSSMLGFPTHADFTVDIRMAKTAANVDAFLKDVAQKLEPIRAKDTARVLQLKKEECERLGYPFVNRIEPSDLRYYINLIKEKDYAVDHHHLKRYFPLRAVKAGVLRLYQHLLGLTFARVNTTDVWHPDVEMYSVTDTDTKELLGYMYLDLHPREGKFGHAAVFGLQPGCLRRNETASGEGVERQVAVAAIVANFTGPSTAQSEAYLLHDEVNTFFHEFGHLMHAICARTDCELFSGTHVETDFVECPSQMLENWVWNEDGLKALLGEEAEPIPKELLDRLLASRKATAGLFYTRQVLLATFDQAIHTTHWNSDPYEVYVEFSRKLCDIDPTPGTCVPASFGHLAGGYDARYYGYLWSEVFSADLYESRFRRAPDGGCLSKTVGREYRTKILQPGGSKDASDMLRDFLGRDPSNSAFFKLLGIQV